ncbi:flagellar basal-body rod protein FlgF [Thermosediminibacter oceani]|uniref:Flagellar basal-body rod protein FlgF n=1 Tax=Thermosediminibacter oceani (strain ATCC BAA-1034 / DSM 16646 / JW/IW-1228P) TaxID=555079 RepID=D9RZV5_THEOJ|nr:flagellar basal-body rod protein FlgF [Thermosediminibacter oceani]ADL08732.1 flagellar basal-body rod protein FlgF [Thermosediminibacter oceani DSM 16646]
MIRGLYTSASGMLAEMARTDVISNNLANINTTGFKKDRAVFRAFPEMNIHRYDDPQPVGAGFVIDPVPYIGVLGTGAGLDEIRVDFTQGRIEMTSNPLDLAIEDTAAGETSFFEIQTPAGIRYTRDGSFTINADGFLVTREGYYVMGENGPINLRNGSKVEINTEGEVYLDGLMVDRLRIAAFPAGLSLEKQGDNLYRAQGVPLPANARIIQGALERANVNAVSEMVNLISAFRAYEANQRMVRAHDDTLAGAVNEIAKI